MAASQELFNRLSNDVELFRRLRKDCAIFSELAYQEADYVQKCWDNAAIDNKFADTLRGLAHGELILPPGVAAHARHVELLSRCRAFAPEYCGGSSLVTDAVMYIIPYNFTPDASQTDRIPDIIILAFRGTNSLKSLFVTDFGFPELINLDNKELAIFDQFPVVRGIVKVDLGFALYLRWLLQNDLQTLCDKDGLLDLVGMGDSTTELRAALCEKPIICTGHSLGGAASTLAALYLKMNCLREVGFINMGSPRVGNSSFAELVKGELSIKCRVVNGGDPVVDLPPDLSSSFPSGSNALSGIFSYAHAGDEDLIDSESKIPLLDHLIAMYIHNLPNSQDGGNGVAIPQSLDNKDTSGGKRVLSQKERRLANRWKGQLKSEFLNAAGVVEDATEGVAGAVAGYGERTLRYIAEWTHI